MPSSYWVNERVWILSGDHAGKKGNCEYWYGCGLYVVRVDGVEKTVLIKEDELAYAGADAMPTVTMGKERFENVIQNFGTLLDDLEGIKQKIGEEDYNHWKENITELKEELQQVCFPTGDFPYWKSKDPTS